MTNYKTRFPDLYQFLGGYFTQDWKELYDWQGKSPNFEDVVRYFKANNPPKLVRRTTGDLRDFLDLLKNDREVEKILEEEFAIGYTPRSRGMNKKEWLQAMLLILQEQEVASELKLIG